MITALVGVAGILWAGDDGSSQGAVPAPTTQPTEAPTTAAAPPAAALLLAVDGMNGAGYQQIAVAGATPAQTGCDEAQVREAIANSGGVAPDLEFDITYLKCADGFGWATITAPNLDSATVLLGVSDAGIEILNLGSSVCTADAGIPADVAAQIAPPGVDPAGDCPAPAPAQQPSITVSPSTAAPGATVTFSGNIPAAGDCPPGSAGLTSTAALFPPDGFGPPAPSDADGNFQVTYTIPAATAPGTYTIGMRCGGGNVGVSTSLQVAPVAGPPVPVPGEPQFTG
jgi:hypothetical protein